MMIACPQPTEPTLLLLVVPRVPPPASALRPVRTGVINPQDFDGLFLHAIDSEIRQGREQKLSRSIFTSDAATMRPFF
jgi:hypothetical protein